MNIRTKKLIMTIIVCMLFVTTVYAADVINYTTVTKSSYTICGTTNKTSSKTSALVQLTQGPVMDECSIQVQMVRVDDSRYISEAKTFYECGTKELKYTYAGTDFSGYAGKTFYVKARIHRSDVYSQVWVKGNVWP